MAHYKTWSFEYLTKCFWELRLWNKIDTLNVMIDSLLSFPLARKSTFEKYYSLCDHLSFSLARKSNIWKILFPCDSVPFNLSFYMRIFILIYNYHFVLINLWKINITILIWSFYLFFVAVYALIKKKIKHIDLKMVER